jgi:LuxR family maltose regulon positive regulatory protein
MIEIEEGKVFELDSPKGSVWLESLGSFRFEPRGNSKAYTVRKEAGIYWYGCRKVAGKVRKKYIGKSSEVTVAKLEEVAEALEIPSPPRASKVAERVVEVTEQVAEVAERVVEVAEDRLTALELQVANLQKAVEALQEALPGKLEAGDSLELPKKLPKVDSEVVERLQNELSNLKAENEKLRADYDALLESSTHITNKLCQEVQALRLQVETERADREEIENELSDLKQKSVAARELPEAADLLNHLKAKRKKAKSDLADMEVILEILEN